MFLALSIQFFLGISATALPADFIWGGHFSGPNLEGRIESTPLSDQGDWYLVEHRLAPYRFRLPMILDASNADIAANHWQHFAEDYNLLPELGLSTASISLSWEKINPSPGTFNPIALNHYKQQIAVLEARGLNPIVALSERTHPQWFLAQGGWNSPSAPALYFEYARKVIDCLSTARSGPKAWITFVDPTTDAINGYFYAKSPPFLGSREGAPDEAFEALFQMGRAHRMIATYVHGVQGSSPRARDSSGGLKGVGLLTMIQGYFSALNDPPSSSKLENYKQDLNWAFAQSLLNRTLTWGGMSRPYPALDLPPEDPHAQTLDWVGLKSGTLFEMNRLGMTVPWPVHAPLQGWRFFTSAHAKGKVVSPDFVSTILKEHTQKLGLPFVIYGADAADPQESFRDTYLAQYLDQLVKTAAQEGGEDLRGFVLGTVIDGFDGMDGYTLKPGLYQIDRKPKPAAKVLLQKIIQHGH